MIARCSTSHLGRQLLHKGQAILSLVVTRQNSGATNKGNTGPESRKMENEFITISYVTAPNEEVAKKLARGLVQSRLAACVNIVKTIESIYEWQGKVEQEQETLLIIKSSSRKGEDLINYVEKNHPYDCPEVVTMKVESGSKKYLDWVKESLNKESISEQSSSNQSTNK